MAKGKGENENLTDWRAGSEILPVCAIDRRCKNSDNALLMGTPDENPGDGQRALAAPSPERSPTVERLYSQLYAGVTTVLGMRQVTKLTSGLPIQQLCEDAVKKTLDESNGTTKIGIDDSVPLAEQPMYPLIIKNLVGFCEKAVIDASATGNLLVALKYMVFEAEIRSLTGGSISDSTRHICLAAKALPAQTGLFAELVAYADRFIEKTTHAPMMISVAAVSAAVADRAAAATRVSGSSASPTTANTKTPWRPSCEELPLTYKELTDELMALCTVEDLKYYAKEAWRVRNTRAVVALVSKIISLDMDAATPDILVPYIFSLKKTGRFDEALVTAEQILLPLVTGNPERHRKTLDFIASIRRMKRPSSAAREEAPGPQMDYLSATPEIVGKCTSTEILKKWVDDAARNGDWPRVVTFRTRMLELCPTNAVGWISLCSALENAGRDQESLDVRMHKLAPLLARRDRRYMAGENRRRIADLRRKLAGLTPAPVESGATNAVEPAAPTVPAAPSAATNSDAAAPTLDTAADSSAEPQLASLAPAVVEVSDTTPAVAAATPVADLAPPRRPLNLDTSTFVTYVDSLTRAAETWDTDQTKGDPWKLIPDEGDRTHVETTLKFLGNRIQLALDANGPLKGSFDTLKRHVKDGRVNMRQLATLKERFEGA